ncbi:hypothetical protein HXP44_29040 [Streptomyces sioyaensis]|uniref:DUF732 domain-containing protein n=1 Tax=Streptomyces sioyaensis TaxID=67364 RepID=A0A4Q1RC61_9ACTN|nr:hypothetical protein [Streptomyces sioyaensis]MBM4795987.1 hypothetical protein [Streptomyces sioyaensis]RXS71106.1 hypothetical protein EST54_01490 [Streptomyces sioyaensis]
MKRTAATALTALVLAAALSACSSDNSTNAAPKKAAKTATPTPSAPSKANSDGEATTGTPPKPNVAAKLGYIRALTGIDPDIVHGREDKAVDRELNQCQTIHNFPKDKSKQTKMAELRFTSPRHPEGFGKVKAAQIVEAVHVNLCPKF